MKSPAIFFKSISFRLFELLFLILSKPIKANNVLALSLLFIFRLFTSWFRNNYKNLSISDIII